MRGLPGYYAVNLDNLQEIACVLPGKLRNRARRRVEYSAHFQEVTLSKWDAQGATDDR